MDRGSPRMVVDRARTPPLLSGAGGDAPALRRGAHGPPSAVGEQRPLWAQAVITPTPGTLPAAATAGLGRARAPPAVSPREVAVVGDALTGVRRCGLRWAFRDTRPFQDAEMPARPRVRIAGFRAAQVWVRPRSLCAVCLSGWPVERRRSGVPDGADGRHPPLP